jgi:hypothetical protein
MFFDGGRDALTVWCYELRALDATRLLQVILQSCLQCVFSVYFSVYFSAYFSVYFSAFSVLCLMLQASRRGCCAPHSKTLLSQLIEACNSASCCTKSQLTETAFAVDILIRRIKHFSNCLRLVLGFIVKFLAFTKSVSSDMRSCLCTTAQAPTKSLLGNKSHVFQGLNLTQ